MKSEINVLLLAAGLGTRIGSQTQSLPKCLLPLGGRTILEHILLTFERIPQFKKLTIVTGFEREKITGFLKSRSSLLDIQEVFNPNFKKGNFFSLQCGLANISPPFFITNADHLFPSHLLEKCSNEFKAVSAVCDFDRHLTPDCMKVEIQPVQGIPKISKIHKKLTVYHAGYIGMTWVSEIGFKDYYSAVEFVGNQKNEQAYAEQVLEHLSSSPNTAPNIIDASGFGWLEVDTVEDLQQAEKTLHDFPNFLIKGRK